MAEVADCRRRLSLRALLRRLLVLLAAGALFPLIIIVVDHLRSDGLPRIAVTGAGLVWGSGLVLVTLLLTIASLWRRLNPIFAARLLERGAGIRHNSLVNALLLKHSPAGEYAYSAATQQAVADVRSHTPGKLSEPGALRMPLTFGAFVLVAWIAYSIVSPKPIGPSLARFFGADLAAPTATRLERLQPAVSDIVHAGEPLEIVFAVHGRQANEVLFEVLEPSGRSAQAVARYELKRIVSGAAGNWTLALAPHEVIRDIHFRCTAGDAVLTGVIPVRPLPIIESMDIELRPPAYTGWPARTVTRPDLDVLAGTWATFHVRANTTIREAVFALEGERETRTRMSVDQAEPRGATLSILIVQGGRYHIDFSDPWGYPYRDPPRHHLVVRPDRPPEVTLTVPAEDEIIQNVFDVTGHQILEAAADDDVRLVDFALVHQQDGISVRSPIAQVTDSDARRARGTVQIADLPFKPGQQLQVCFEALDNRVLPDARSAPQIGRSRELTLVWPIQTSQPSKPPEPAEAPSEAADGESEGDDPNSEGWGTTGDSENGGTGDQTEGDDENQADGEDFTGELEQFLEEHGEMAREVDRRVRQAAVTEDEAPDGDEQVPAESEAEQTDGNSEDDLEPNNEAEGQAQADSSEAGDVKTGQEEPAEQDGSSTTDGEMPSDSEGLAETVDLLEMLERGTIVSEEILIEMGWSAEKSMAFVEALERLHATVRDAGENESLRRLYLDTELGDDEIQQGLGLAENMATDVVTAQVRQDNLREIAAPPEQHVPAHLRRLLDAYYQALAQQEAQTTSTDK